MNLRDYALVTAAYWAFTITDGALRMLVLLHFHDLGYDAVSLAFLFLLYELFGVITNLFGGWLGDRRGVNQTLIGGLALQVVALLVLSITDPGWTEVLSVVWVMGAQALAGIAKDLTKMSSKSAVRFVVDDDDGVRGALFRWVAILTGSKNALKGVGFFVGAALLGSIGFAPALRTMAVVLALVAVGVTWAIRSDLGRSAAPRSVRSLLSKSSAINRLSAARFFLFASRDIWFVVALPVFLSEELGWSFEGIGAFLALWVIGYGGVQTVAPRLVAARDVAASQWVLALGVVVTVIAVLVTADTAVSAAVVVGLVVFGIVFAVNSSLHSYLILAFSNTRDVVVDVGFYYAANAAGRLAGTLGSGVLYLVGGFEAALWGSAATVTAAWLLSIGLEERVRAPALD